MASTKFSKDPTVLLRADDKFQLADLDPASTPGFKGKKQDGVKLLAARSERLAELQEKLFAAGKEEGQEKSVLLVIQGMDTSGKGGVVNHVVGSVNPQGVQFYAFKAPTDEEKKHDFLWRVRKQVPRPRMLGVFDRSHYEDVLIHRVHAWADEAELERRYQAINDFEAELRDQGTVVVKVMMHIDKDTQKERLEARLADPSKYWKYNPGDITERGFWDQYMQAYQLVLAKTSTDNAPWFVIPAARKWYARIAVQELLISALESLDLSWPPADFDVTEEKRRLAES